MVERNGRIVRDHVFISGNDEHHPEGAYYIEWHEAGRRRRQVIPAFSELIENAGRKALELDALRAGIILRKTIPPATEPGPQRIPIGTAIDNRVKTGVG